MSRSNKRISSRPRLVFFGNERLATTVTTTAPTLRALVNAGYEVEAVVVSHRESVSRTKRALEIAEVAHAYHIPLIMPAGKSDILSKLKGHHAESAVLVAFGRLIPE
ncbi:MAG TPA: hypothetical protein VFW90_02755, partial [Candidatus Saccharimonadales bacterium]|nr:hypothetical protein [Candidatus Saccharimonadales bacterium]